MTPPDPAPPPRLDDSASLFLDLDGTLLELMDRPDAVFADDMLQSLLMKLHRRMERRVAIVSGRSLAQLDEILGPVARHLALSGSHGGEIRVTGHVVSPARPAELDRALEAMREFAASNRPVLIEEKSLGVALHYRQMPLLGPKAFHFAQRLADELGLFVQEGNMMVELRPIGHDKGTAIQHLMAQPLMMGTTPVFAGDDVTDETGFAVVAAMGGYGVLVGNPRPTGARFCLPDPAAVRGWLKENAE